MAIVNRFTCRFIVCYFCMTSRYLHHRFCKVEFKCEFNYALSVGRAAGGKQPGLISYNGPAGNEKNYHNPIGTEGNI